MVVVDALDPADERAAHALEAGLLAELAHDRLGQRLAGLDPAAGHRPLARAPARGPAGPAAGAPSSTAMAPTQTLGGDASTSRLERPVHHDAPGR